MRPEIPPEVMRVWEILNEKGETLLVGGLVRDHLLGLADGTQDYDFATIHEPDAVAAILQPLGYPVIPTGIDFGTVTILAGDHKLEATTYRGEQYSPGNRKPDVFYSKSFSIDCLRRDFTINSLGVTADGTLVDPNGGLGDIRQCILRAVGSPGDRFNEDPLRILRGIRLATKLGFIIHDWTWNAMVANAFRLHELSKERVVEELRKILLLPKPGRALVLMKSIGVLREIFPELDALSNAKQANCVHHFGDAFQHTVAAVNAAPADYITRLAVLYHDVGKPLTETFREDGAAQYLGHPEVGKEIWLEVAKQDKYGNDVTETVAMLIEHHLRPAQCRGDSMASLRRLYRKIGDNWDRLVAVSRADVLGHKDPDLSSVEAFAQKMNEVAMTALPPRANVLPKGTGSALMHHFPELRGKALGDAMRELEGMVVDGSASRSDDPDAYVVLWSRIVAAGL